MIADEVRESLYQELRQSSALWAKAGSRRLQHTLGKKRDDELTHRWRQDFADLKDQLMSQLLLLLHTLFDFSADDQVVRSTALKSLAHLFEKEEACIKEGFYDAQDYALYLFRRYWHEATKDSDHKVASASGISASEPKDTLLTGIDHLERASFFRKTPQRIATWTQWFLLIRHYHRFDTQERENRRARYRFLRSMREQGVSLLLSLEDLIVWLAFRLEEASIETVESGSLSRNVSRELDGLISPDVLQDEPLQPIVYVFLKCHQFCLSKGIESSEKTRLEQLFATRELDSLIDLMRVLLDTVDREQITPEVGRTLDQLCSKGFNVEHQSFKDPYEAMLVPLSDTERLESCRLPLFFHLDALCGEYRKDLELSHHRLIEWQRRISCDILDDCAAYGLALAQPLPKANLVHKLVRFAVSWTLARYQWPISELNQDLENDVQKLLPDNVIRHMIRPRKGYEIKSRQELKRLIEAETRQQREGLERIVSGHLIQGYHDYYQFARYVAFQTLRENLQGQAIRISELGEASIGKAFLSEMVEEFCRRWKIESRYVHPHTLESVQQYLIDVVPPAQFEMELEKSFETSNHELSRIYTHIMNQARPAFHLLLVANGRHKANLPRLSISTDQIPQMVHLLVSPVSILKEKAFSRCRKEFARAGSSLYRCRLRPCILDEEEWNACLAWKAMQHMGNSPADFLEHGNLDALLSKLEQETKDMDISPEATNRDTLRSSLVNLFRSPDERQTVSNEEIREILPLLPQLDCAACGYPSCYDFAGSLLRGNGDPGRCQHLQSGTVLSLNEKVAALKGAYDGIPSVTMFDLLTHRHLWRNSPRRQAFNNVLSVQIQEARRIFLGKLKNLWDGLLPKPQIFKSPDLETLYNEFCRYMGLEATERLREEERSYLVEHGDERQKAEWLALKRRQDWLLIANRNRQSSPMLATQEPQRLAQLAYGSVLFLHQLDIKDRQIVLRHRMEEHKDGFSLWWNEDLLTMNLPDFSIRDWEDFSKIIKNAYWHQEFFPSPDEVVYAIVRDSFAEKHSRRVLDELVTHWTLVERKGLEAGMDFLKGFRERQPNAVIGSMTDLRDLLRSMFINSLSAAQPPAGDKSKSGAAQIAALKQVSRIKTDLFDIFQKENFAFSPDFSCTGDELSATEKEALEKNSYHAAEPGLPRTFYPHHLHEKGSTILSKDWAESFENRASLIRAAIDATVENHFRERTEFDCANKSKNKSLLSLGSIRIFVRQMLILGKDPSAVEAEVDRIFFSEPDHARRLVHEVILRLVLRRQYELLPFSDKISGYTDTVGAELSHLLEVFPELNSALSALIDRQKSFDRERLLHYLFLLAKMEGNLDTLTALLKEIRETADIIEAAWLRFTQDRIIEGPSPKTTPAVTLGIPLLASRLENKEPVNRGLKEGVSRKEKKSVANAVKELLDIIRYHILLFTDGRWPLDPVQTILKEIKEVGYDLSGIDDEALMIATQRQLERKEQLVSQKIWIYTSVTARRLAAQSLELQEAEREFYKIRQDILKDELDCDALNLEIACRRGIALDQIKEEAYRQLSDLLEPERIASFQKRIRQIVDELDRKREEIHAGWLNGQINRRTLFHILRQYQKLDQEPTWDDFQRFIRDHWIVPMAELRNSQRHDHEERIHYLDDRFRSLLGASLLEMEAECSALAKQNYEHWIKSQLDNLESSFS